MSKVKIEGESVYIDLEGGFYGIIDRAGNQYFAINMPEQYKYQGAKVKATIEKLPDVFSITMWGEVIRISSFEVVA